MTFPVFPSFCEIPVDFPFFPGSLNFPADCRFCRSLDTLLSGPMQCPSLHSSSYQKRYLYDYDKTETLKPRKQLCGLIGFLNRCIELPWLAHFEAVSQSNCGDTHYFSSFLFFVGGAFHLVCTHYPPRSEITTDKNGNSWTKLFYFSLINAPKTLSKLFDNYRPYIIYIYYSAMTCHL